MRLGTIQTVHKTFWQRMKNQITQDVPTSVEQCEYNCRKPNCTEKEWATCERRTQRMQENNGLRWKPAFSEKSRSRNSNAHLVDGSAR